MNANGGTGSPNSCTPTDQSANVGPTEPGGGFKCNTLEVCGAAVVPVSRNDAVPAPNGGTIQSGTYYLTAVETYGSAADCAAGTVYDRGTLYFDAETSSRGVVSEVYEAPGGTLIYVTAKYTTNGTLFDTVLTCYGGTTGENLGTGSIGFTAAENELRLFDQSGDCSVINVMTRY
jgi:hypothetical protein